MNAGVGLALSCDRIVKLYVSRLVGVPAITPPDKVNPRGSAPALSV